MKKTTRDSKILVDFLLGFTNDSIIFCLLFVSAPGSVKAIIELDSFILAARRRDAANESLLFDLSTKIGSICRDK